MKLLLKLLQLKSDFFGVEMPVQGTEISLARFKKIHVCQLSYLLCCKTMGFSSFVAVSNYACRRPFMRFLLTDLFWSFEEIGNLKDGNRIEFYSY